MTSIGRLLAGSSLAILSVPAAAQTSSVATNPYVFADDFETATTQDWGLTNAYFAAAGECGNASRSLALNDGPGTCSFNAAFPGWYSATAQQPVQYHPTKRMEVDFNYRYLLPGQHAELNLRAQGPYYDGYFMLEWFSPIAGDDQWHHRSLLHQHFGAPNENPAGTSFHPWFFSFDDFPAPQGQGGAFLDDLVIRPEGAGAAFCDGAACPCGNDDTSPIARGCKNSTGRGAWLHAYGDTSLATDELEVVAYDLPQHKPVLLFSGTTQLNGGAGQPFGDGLRCVGGALSRIDLTTTGGAGERTWIGTLQGEGWTSGQTIQLQAYYRDGATGPCGTGFNTTNGYSFVVTP